MQEVTIALFASASTLMALAALAVCLRLYVRIFMIKSLGSDDYLMVAALACYIVAEAVVFDATIRTEGKTILELLDVITPAMKDMYLGEVFYVLSVLALKLSIGTFLLRVVNSRVQRYTIYGVLLVVTLYSIAYLCMVIFQCIPVSHFWNVLGKGKCLPGYISTKTSYVHAALTGGSDLLFATIPIVLVWKLQMNMSMKISVAGLLGLGALGGITTFIRMPYVKALEEATALQFFDATSKLAIWTCIEPGVGIFVGSLATLRPLFKKALGGSQAFNSKPTNSAPSSRSRSTKNQYLRSDQSSHQLDTFSDANKKAGFTTTVVKGSLTKNGARWGGKLEDNESEEELNNLEGGIQRVVEFEAISTTRTSPIPTKEDPFSAQRRFY